MKTLTNRLLQVAALALELSKKHLPDDSHRNRPTTYTQPQLFACLVLKTYMKTACRGIIEYLEVADQLVKTLKLKVLPDYSIEILFTAYRP